MNKQDKKQVYRQFAEREKLPIFMQPYWLDAVCEPGMNWDVILYERGGEIWGSFVYVVKKKYGFTLITMPKLTQFLGPYIKYPKGQKYYKKLSWEKEVMNYFIDNLPKFDFFNTNFHFSITNWLPFYWRGFKQTTRYTYVIDRDIPLDHLTKEFETDVRRRRRKAEKLGVKVVESNDIEKFYKLNKMTFSRKKKNIPYSFELVKNLYEKAKEHNACEMLFAVEGSGEVIAASFLVYDKTTVYYLMGGIDPKKKDMGGMDLVLYESIKFALESGKNFDFEGSMIESIEKYFRSFGGIQKPYFQIYKVNSKILRFYKCIKGALY